MTRERRLLVTGGSGFIGSHLLASLTKTGDWDEIHAIRHSMTVDERKTGPIMWHQADLLHAATPRELIDHIRPSHLIHGAWITDHGKFWTHNDNARWLEASLNLADAFADWGGVRFVNLGSVAEYDWAAGRMIESITAEIPETPYGEAKLAFQRGLSERSQKGHFSSATGRVFFTNGPGEKATRLVPSACRSLITGKSEAFGSGHQWRDYIHVSDLARGIIALTESTLEGAINIASGTPTRLSVIFDELEKLCKAPGLIQRGSAVGVENDVPMLFADTGRIATTGWYPIISLEDGLAQTLKWWKTKIQAESDQKSEV